MKKIFFSKNFEDIVNIKKNFLYENNKLLKQAHNWNKIYSKQAKRKKCKNCEKKLGFAIINSHYANYTVCKNCNHFNGINEDTESFNNMLYSNKFKKNLSNFYNKDYNERCKKIYYPK